MAAFAGAGATGERVSSTFVFDPVFIMPDLSKREKTEIVFVAVFFHGGRAVVYDAEVALGVLADESFLEKLSTMQSPPSALWRGGSTWRRCKSW